MPDPTTAAPPEPIPIPVPPDFPVAWGNPDEERLPWEQDRIPAVVGVGTATSAISDGQILEVDGDTGVVRIVG